MSTLNFFFIGKSSGLSMVFSSRRPCLKGHQLQVRHKQDWGQGLIILLSQAAVLPGSDAGSDFVTPALNFVIQNRQTLCSRAPTTSTFDYIQHIQKLSKLNLTKSSEQYLIASQLFTNKLFCHPKNILL